MVISQDQAKKEIEYQMKQYQLALDVFCEYRNLSFQKIKIPSFEEINLKEVYINGLGNLKISAKKE